MVVGAFPAAKLGVLAIKQISKPIANVIKNKAKQSPFFRKWVCMPPAQMYNWVEVKTKMWALNLGKTTTVPQLNEAMAIELGANLLGETIIFTIGAGVLIFEYIRQSNKEAKKEEDTKQEKLQLYITLSEMGMRLERQDAQIREMSRILADLDSRSIFKFGKTKNLLGDQRFEDEERNDKVPERVPTYTGNYNPSNGNIFKALNMIENKLFNYSYCNNKTVDKVR